MRISTFMILIGAVSLSACVAVTKQEATTEAPAPLKADAPAVEAESQATTPPEISSQEEAALPPAKTLPPIDDRPERFLGLGTAALAQELGEPQLLRREAPAEIWQYRGEGCILDLFLYPEAGSLKVTHIEARDKKAESYETKDCLRQLIEARRTAPIG